MFNFEFVNLPPYKSIELNLIHSSSCLLYTSDAADEEDKSEYHRANISDYPEKEKFISLCNRTFKTVAELLFKLKSGPGEDMFIATMLIHRVYHFNKNCLENSNENPNLSEIQIQQLASSNAKLKCLIQILSHEDEDPDEDEWIKFNSIDL